MLERASSTWVNENTIDFRFKALLRFVYISFYFSVPYSQEIGLKKLFRWPFFGCFCSAVKSRNTISNVSSLCDALFHIFFDIHCIELYLGQMLLASFSIAWKIRNIELKENGKRWEFCFKFLLQHAALAFIREEETQDTTHFTSSIKHQHYQNKIAYLSVFRPLSMWTLPKWHVRSPPLHLPPSRRFLVNDPNPSR